MSGNFGTNIMKSSRSSRRSRQTKRQKYGGQHRRGCRKRHQRGGVGNASSGLITNATSAADFQMKNVGTMNQQWDNVFKGPTNMYGATVRNLAMTEPSSPADASVTSGNAPFQNGGRSRRHSKSRKGGCWGLFDGNQSKKSKGRGKGRSRKGGFFGAVLQEAAVPFGLLAANNYYGKRTRKHRKHRKHHK